MVVVHPPQVDAVGFGRRHHLVGAARDAGQDSVKVLVVHQLIAERGGDGLGVAVHPPGDAG